LSNNALDQYKQKNSATINLLNISVNKLLSDSGFDNVKITNQLISNNWAAVSLVPKTPLDPALVVLNNNNGDWQIVAGPGTAYTEDDLVNFGHAQRFCRQSSFINHQRGLVKSIKRLKL